MRELAEHRRENTEDRVKKANVSQKRGLITARS